MSRLPLRVRLVAGFSAAMLLVLLGADAFVYWRVEFALDRGLDTDLTHARNALDDGLRTTGSVDDQAAAVAGAVFQVLGADGTVLQAGPGTPGHALVPLDRLGADDHVNVGALLPVSPDPLRLLVSRVQTSAGDEVYLVVGVRRDHRDEALRELLVQLGLASLGALVVTGFVGDRLARSALAPVERYRRRAEQIAGGAGGLRLDVPPDRDDEVTRLGHTLNDMLDELDRALAAERRFVDDASHELRTPLTLLTARLQQTQRRSRTVDEHEAVLQELAVDVDRLRTLADQLLELDAHGAEGTTADARLVLEEVAARHDPALTLRLPAHPVPVPIAPLALERIAENLIRNAELHGAPPVIIELSQATEVTLTVSDRGRGLPAELRGHATERFTRAPDARSRPGSGLGLAIVEELVTRSAGQLLLDTRADGFEARVSLPLPLTQAPEPVRLQRL